MASCVVDRRISFSLFYCDFPSLGWLGLETIPAGIRLLESADDVLSLTQHSGCVLEPSSNREDTDGSGKLYCSIREERGWREMPV